MLASSLACARPAPHGSGKKKAAFQLLACYENKCEVMLPSPSGSITIERQTHSLLEFAWLVRTIPPPPLTLPPPRILRRLPLPAAFAAPRRRL